MSHFDEQPDGDPHGECAAEIRLLQSEIAALVAALREIDAINDESPGDCRKRMGTRRGNSIVVARAAIARATGAIK